MHALGLFGHFDFVEITCNHVFDKWRAQWKADADAAGAAVALGLDSGLAGRLVALANGADGEDFFRTRVLDVILSRHLKQFSETVDQSVHKQILERLDAFPRGQQAQWSAIAHSLGTAVLHNTLHAMFTQPVDGVLLGDAYMPTNLYMVANVGKVLWNKGGIST